MPKVSVILPVYNAEKYLKEAIDSILNQTFLDFELILVNDGSTDGSEDIIRSFDDKRIVYVKNEKNSGLINTLNRGIDLASGEYIARMDGDDIAMRERLEKQLDYLLKNDVVMLGTSFHFINEHGELLDSEEKYKNTLSSQQIRRTLPKDNCLAHPTVMAKASIFKKYRYHPELVFDYKFIHNQTYSEDYDLWLRLVADKLKVEKMPEPLLFYRVLPGSVTRFGNVNIFYRLAKIKFRFIRNQIKLGRFSWFHCKVLYFACIDFFKGMAKHFKRKFRKMNYTDNQIS